MKRSLVNQNHLKKQTGNTLQDIVEQSIDNETRMVIEYFEAHNLPYHMVNGIAIRDDDTKPQKQKFVNMTCTKCKKLMICLTIFIWKCLISRTCMRSQNI